MAPATMDMLKDTGGTWAQEIQQYEREKRRAVNEELLKGPSIRVSHGFVKSQERTFDPLLQRYRQPETELHQRVTEENARVAHLNRAQDIQILRENPYNVVTNESRLEPLHQGEPLRIGPQRPARKKYPDSFVDHNILSNIPHSLHHWAEPSKRPQVTEKQARVREVPAFTQKDYNVITNRYLTDHDEKIARDRELNLLEATTKHRHRNRFDPVNQLYVDPGEEERMRTFNDAHETEIVQRAQKQLPPTVKNRHTAFYNAVNHDIANGDMLKWIDLAEDERKERYKNRYIVEHNLHAQDIKNDHIEHTRKLNRVSLERFQEPIQRGYDIVNNARMEGRGGQGIHHPYCRKKLTPWERMQEGRSASMPPGKSSQQRFTPASANVNGSATEQPQSAQPSMNSATQFDRPLAHSAHASPTNAARAQSPMQAPAAYNVDDTLLPSDLEPHQDVSQRPPRMKTSGSNGSHSRSAQAKYDVTSRPPRAPSMSGSERKAPSVISGNSAPRSKSALGLTPARASSPMYDAPISVPRGASPAPMDMPSMRATPPPPPLPGSPVGSVYSRRIEL
eukprot:gnl/MRDRNA2_/MRDRNA2_92127_c0_seq1.p1 gnl/MRDRNA2_/MRDRNA2_92127_c0~~gnl/MRDRNA2_/MRDRNA2_92127_c0_seq1.p1  ORF type:complete len:590 (-),score=110.26 gnl/MRDRNA2_/MRDRNA2_92127_c0_seq1:11-1702(-)